MAEKIAITFDEDNQIRVLESDKFRETDALKNESIGFISSTSASENPAIPCLNDPCRNSKL